jgi:hypothetical protein
VDLRTLASGYQISQALYVAATLGVADRLADGPKTSDELAREVDAHPDALYRLLRALASVGVLTELDDRTFELAPLGEGLRDVPGSLHGWVAFIGRPPIWQAWGDLLNSVRTGENAFRRVHGMSPWEYRAQHLDESRIFDKAMHAITGLADQALVAAYDFGQFGTIVDVGGGDGSLLRTLLPAFPSLRGVVFDQAHVVDAIEPTDRLEVVSGSFFESIPAGGDAYLLKQIIHDWEDPESIAILRNIAAVLPADGAVLVIERDLGAPNTTPAAKFADLNMLVGPGGRERTDEQYAALFEAAGLRQAGTTPSPSGWSVFEARR